jgi:hypothetical protein
MAQFVAYVYPVPGGYRVFIEGLGDAAVASLEEADRAALRIAARSVYSSYPDREAPERPGTAARIDLEVRIVKSPPAATPRQRSGDIDSISPAPSTARTSR